MISVGLIIMARKPTSDVGQPALDALFLEKQLKDLSPSHLGRIITINEENPRVAHLLLASMDTRRWPIKLS